MLWLSLSGGANFLDLSVDTISPRAALWPKDNQPIPEKIRYKFLKLGEGTRQERRYYRPDLEALLV